MARNRDPQRERMVRRRERRRIQLRCRVIVVRVRVLSWGSNTLTRACSQNQFSLLRLVFAHMSRSLDMAVSLVSPRAKLNMETRAGTCNQSYGLYESAWDGQALFLVFCASSKCGYRQS